MEAFPIEYRQGWANILARVQCDPLLSRNSIKNTFRTDLVQHSQSSVENWLDMDDDIQWNTEHVATDLYSKYKNWCDHYDSNRSPYSLISWNSQMRKLGYEGYKIRNVLHYKLPARITEVTPTENKALDIDALIDRRDRPAGPVMQQVSAEGHRSLDLQPSDSQQTAKIRELLKNLNSKRS
jgi:hypothetical protein